MEIKKGQIINFPGTLQRPSEASVVRAKSFKISSAAQNFAQYVRTVKAYALAGLPLEHIANAGDEIGDIVERADIDAAVLESSQSKAGEIAEDESKILAWQNRGETVSIVKQLPSAAASKELISIEQDLPALNPSQNQTIKVIEGMGIAYEPQDQLDNNPYLKPLPDLKKAA